MSLKNMFGSKKKLVEVTGDSSSAPAKPTPPPPADDEKQYELEVPPNTLPGAKLKLTIPGMTEKVVITVPEGAVPGATIQFSLPKSGLKPGAANEATQVKLQQERAAIMIQARMRGQSTRSGLHSAKATKMQLTKSSSNAAAKAEEIEYDAAELVLPLAPTLTPDYTGSAPVTTIEEEEEVSEKPPAAPPPTPAAGFLKRTFTSALSIFQSAPALPASAPESADALELTRVAGWAIEACEEADFDMFAHYALPSVQVAMPGVNVEGMQGVWQARLEEGQVEGILSLDTVMAQLDDETHGTVVGLEHCHDTQTSGMVVKHSWVRFQLEKIPPVEGNGAGGWKIASLTFDPIWPIPQEEDADPEEYRLGLGKTARGCSDVASLTSVFFTSWLAGDKSRFEATADPEVSISVKALGIVTKGYSASYDARAKLLEYGNLIAVNSPMVDAESEPGKIRVLAHAHLYDVTTDESMGGAPTVHFALGLTFTVQPEGSPLLSHVVSDVIWMGEGKMPETEGLSFESPPLDSVYTRSLTFVKAWETNAVEGILPLTTRYVELVVPRYNKDVKGQKELLAYRETLNVLGMITADSVRVTPTRFEAYLHEYGIEPGQHGLPRMHAGIKLDFEPQRDGSVLISRIFLDVEYVPAAARRSSIAVLNEDLTLAAEL